MKDIELVIKIPEEIYQHYKKVWQKRRGSIPETCIAFGTPLPKGHGRLIDADVLQNNFEWLEKVTSESNAIDKAKYEQLTECIRMVKKMPTIVEADRESEE